MSFSTSELEEAEQAAYDAVCLIGTYKVDFDDCSNNAYELWYWWLALGHKAKIMLVSNRRGYHAQVEGEKGFYDPTQRSKIKKSPSQWGIVGNKYLINKLPGRYDFESYVKFETILDPTGSEFQFPTKYQYEMQKERIFRKSRNAREQLDETRIINGRPLTDYLKFGGQSEKVINRITDGIDPSKL